jgi:transposase
VRRNCGSNIALLAGMTFSGMGPSLAVEGATTRMVSEAHVEKALVPSLRSGRTLVMDNLSAHERPRVRQPIDERGCELVYLLPYSLDFDPVEQTFRSSKAYWAEPRPAPARPQSKL